MWFDFNVKYEKHTEIPHNKNPRKIMKMRGKFKHRTVSTRHMLDERIAQKFNMSTLPQMIKFSNFTGSI